MIVVCVCVYYYALVLFYELLNACQVFHVVWDNQRKRVTPECSQGSVAAGRNSFEELNLKHYAEAYLRWLHKGSS